LEALAIPAPYSSAETIYPQPARGEREMTWKTPKIIELAVGLEINMYACAVRK
jgi:coenzyme PQQ precursor peptide PqqA